VTLRSAISQVVYAEQRDVHSIGAKISMVVVVTASGAECKHISRYGSPLADLASECISLSRAKPHPQSTQIDIREQSRRNMLTHGAGIVLQ